VATPTDHIQGLEQNIKAVKRLVEIHEQLAGKTRGRKYNVEVLHKSGIVLLVACWEAFIEDLAAAAFDTMLANASSHSTFPAHVLALASKPLRTAHDIRDVWRLAGDGWRIVLQDHKRELFAEYIGKLNTPKPKQINALFHHLIGIAELSSAWHWRAMSPEAACEKLNGLIELRGSIAHRVAASESVYKGDVLDYMWFIYRLATISSNRLLAFVHAKTKKSPWPRYRFRHVA
jgi:hypothetical protein